MIKGIGVDILEKKRISLIHAKYGERFENRILGKQEKQELKLRNKLNKTRFIANNFVCKEAFSKALEKASLHTKLLAINLVLFSLFLNLSSCFSCFPRIRFSNLSPYFA